MTTACPAVETIDKQAGIHPLKWMFTFPAVLAALLATLAVLTVRSRFDDPDMWWHMRMGQIIWTTHSIPTTDIFSYTTGHHAYVPHEWLSQLFIYGAYRFGGFTGLMVWLCVFAAALFVAGYILCSLYSQNAKVAFLGALTIWLFSTIGLAIRPQMIGYLFLTVELLILHLGKTRNPRWFLALPPMFAIWVNCHGSFFLGLAIAGLVLVSSFFHFRSGLFVSTRWDSRRRRVFAWAIAFSVLALFLNPIGLDQILYPINTFLHQPVGLSQVEEWQHLAFDDPRAFVLLAALLGPFLLAIVRNEDLFLDEVLILALGVWLATNHRRMLFVFGILVAPVLSRMLSTAWEGYDKERDRPLPNAIFIAASLLTILWVFPNRQLLARQVETQSPVRAVEFMERTHLSGRMLNEYVYGGYLIWAAPDHPVFVDGRGDVFDATGVFADFAKWETLDDDPKQLLMKYRIDFCLLANKSPMVRVLSLLHWTTIYSDTNSVILVRDESLKISQ